MPKHYISVHDLDSATVTGLLESAARIKTSPGDYRDALKGQTLAMIFEKSSTRTRVSFEVGMYQLGGQGLFLSSRDIQLGRGEPISDTAKVLSRYCDGIMARTFAHATVTGLADNATVPVINGLTDLLHPCQSLTDVFTMMEKWGGTPDALRGKKLAYVGDGNNMAHSLMYIAPKVGMNIAIACPPGYEPNQEVLAAALADAMAAGTELSVTDVLAEALAGADAVETDVWASMGQEDEQQKRVQDFAGWQITQEQMAHAASDALFLHCLPAHRGEEVSAEVCDGPQSVIFDQAENRLHAQKAILVDLMSRD